MAETKKKAPAVFNMRVDKQFDEALRELAQVYRSPKTAVVYHLVMKEFERMKFSRSDQWP
jgi:predicted transcriptional regulator